MSHIARRISDNRLLFWAVLMLPALPAIMPVLAGEEPYRHAIRPTGEVAAILLVLALCLTPLRMLAPEAKVPRWLIARRRQIGLAAFGHAALHLVFFVLSIGRLDYIVQGLAWASMWTGWLALLLIVPVAATSHDRAMRALGRSWKKVQRLAYGAAALTLAHWLLLTNSPQEALVWFAPLAILLVMRFIRTPDDKHASRGDDPR